MSAATSSLSDRRIAWPKIINNALYVVGMMPAVWTFYLAITGQAGADPQKVLERTLGLWALRYLVIGLTISPLRRIGGPNLLRYRRTIGLLAFFYAALHVTVYIWLDQSLDIAAIVNDIIKRPYITIGMLSFLILVPLAITSNKTMIEKLGGSAWQKLHRWVYLASGAAALHFIMLVKAWPAEPLIYAGLVAGLLLFRLFDRRTKNSGKRATRLSPAAVAGA